MQNFCNDATLFLCYYPEKSYHSVQHGLPWESTQPLWWEADNTCDSRRYKQNGQDYISVCGQREKKSHWLKYTATLWDFEEWKCH